MSAVKVIWTHDYAGHNRGEVSGLSDADARAVLGKYASPFLERAAVTKAVEPQAEKEPETKPVEQPKIEEAKAAVEVSHEQVVNSPKGRRHR